MSILIKNSSKDRKFVKNGSGCTLWNILQPIPDRFKQRHFLLRNWSPFRRRHSSIEPIRTVGSLIRGKSFIYTKFLKRLKICQKWSGLHSLEIFAADIRSFQVKTLVLDKFKFLINHSRVSIYRMSLSSKKLHDNLSLQHKSYFVALHISFLRSATTFEKQKKGRNTVRIF